MSLIERAVKKIGGEGRPPVDGPPAEAARTASTVPASQAEHFLPSTAQVASSHAASHAVAPSPVVPAQPAPDFPSVEIDLPNLRERGFAVPNAPASAILQEFRVIKRPLIANAYGRDRKAARHGKRIMVTSALPGEGKSFCAINLAMSIAAERDHAVLLVDADVAKPSILSEFGLPARAGLMDWLIDGAPDLSELILQTNVEKLAILPAGRRDEHATEYLASAGMTRLLETLSARYPDRIIVFDSPPLLVTTEARVLASYMGQIVMVVEAGRTPRGTVQEAIAAIEGCEIVGLLLNKAKNAKKKGGYHGYDGYGYGSD